MFVSPVVVGRPWFFADIFLTTLMFECFFMDFKIVTFLVHTAPALGTEFDGTAEKISDIQLGFDVILS